MQLNVRFRSILALIAASTLALGAAACGSDSDSSSATTTGSGSNAAGDVRGMGSTFAAPVYQQWGEDLDGQGITVNYQGVGSGAGIAGLANGTTTFAGSDPALTADDRALLTKGDVTQIPMFLGAITVSYNVNGISKGLKLDGKTIADIYLGTITKWNDPRIAKLNAGMSLPAETITVVHRSDSSGTTKGFTTFLAASSSQWKSGVGADKSVKWPTGTGARGNDGVAAAIKQNEGAIGYVEQAYALQNDFTYASVKNSDGSYISPTLASTSAAGDELDVPADLGIDTINAPGAKAYPITSQTFIVVYDDPCKALKLSADNAKALKAFLDYGLGSGQAVLERLRYAKLPSGLLDKSKAAVAELTCDGTAIG